MRTWAFFDPRLCTFPAVDASRIGESWLGGYQLTDSNGQVVFQTIMPGWYAGRTTRIHLRVRSRYDSASSPSDGTNTTQRFFDQSVDDDLAANVAPCSSEGSNPTTNAADCVYTGQTHAIMQVTLTGDYVNGFTSFGIYLPITVA